MVCFTIKSMRKFFIYLMLIVIAASQPVAAIDSLPRKTIDKYLEGFEYYKFRAQYRKDYKLVKQLYDNSLAQNIPDGIIKFGNVLGVIARDSAEYDRSIRLHYQALKLAQMRKDTLEQIITLNNLGVVCRRQFRPVQATNYHLEALKLTESLPINDAIIQRSVGIGLNSMGNINLMQENYRKAIDYFQRAIKTDGSANSLLGMAINYNNIGEAYVMLNQPDSALQFYKKSLEINIQIKSQKGIAICNNGIGSAFLKKQDALNALRHFLIAKEVLENQGDPYNMAETNLNIGEAYIMSLQLRKAKSFIEKGIELASGIGTQGRYARGLTLLSNWNEQMGYYASALKYRQEAKVINDSIISERNNQYLHDLQTLYDSERKELEITRLNQEKVTQEQQFHRRQMYWYIAIVMLTALVIMIFLLNHQRKLKDKHMQSKLEQTILRSQMNPHFIFNMLLTIQNSIYQENKVKAYNLLGQFSKMTRSVLEYSQKEFITLEEEIKLLETYMILQKNRFDFDFEINIDPDLRIESMMIPPMLVQPFIENAIDHGIRPVEYRGKITLELKKQNNSLQVNVNDNGIGINKGMAKRKENHSSTALKIFKARTEVLGKLYKKNVNFEVVDLADNDTNQTGTLVTFNIPINWDKR
ncbi:tetratricopeptide repeat protein [Prolixibacteraceae bacterium JC049]|nr:tetratricopeptide repeat protein [Prolixibacteraceae bacterium JC049]